MREIPFHPPEQVFSSFAATEGALFLDSSDPSHPLSRWSFIAYDPVGTLEPDHIPEALRSFPASTGLPFTGGVAGVFGYDTEDSRLALYDKVIAFDLHTRKSWLCGKAELPSLQPAKPYSIALAFQPLKARADYIRDIERAIRYICDGDIFQVNLAQYFTADIPSGFDPYAHYLHLRRVNPAPFSAFLNCGDHVLASTSPERFLSVQNGLIETRPIKGTLSCIHPASALAASEKDRAENIMIVDLLRNDLSKICHDNSIDVTSLCSIESFSGLHHMVSTVTGRLLDSSSAFEALMACSPGGSITGAPKIRAMEIISELEPIPRRAYCGSIGYLTPHGNMDTNIAIRTLQYRGGEVIYGAGGGITASSDPDAEYEETLLKARKVFESFRP